MASLQHLSPPLVRDRAPDSPNIDPAFASATIDELSHPPAHAPAAPLDSILLPHQYIVFLFPVTMIAGSAFGFVMGDTPSYFSNKRNLLNVLFAKNGWGWTSLVFFVFLALVFGSALFEEDRGVQQQQQQQQQSQVETAQPVKSGSTTAIVDDAAESATITRRTQTRTSNDVINKPAGQNIVGTHVPESTTEQAILPSLVIVKALVRWGLATAYWWVIAQWFFGPAIFDRVFVMTGGSCSVDNAFSSYHCRRQGGIWSGGVDISGHMFLLTHSCLFLVEELSVFWNVPEAWSALARRQAARYAVYAAITIAGLWWWMLLMTSVYYHHMAEKLSGLFFGLLFWFCTYVTVYKKTPFPSMPDQAVVL